MADLKEEVVGTVDDPVELASLIDKLMAEGNGCLLYTSDAADE